MARTKVQVLAVAGVMLVLGGVAHAEPVVYTWTGYGGYGPTSTGNKCSTYKMTVDVSVDGDAVKGVFQQVWRDERKFEAKLLPDGTFKTATTTGTGQPMEIRGVIKEGASHVTLDGYCKFEANLAKK